MSLVVFKPHGRRLAMSFPGRLQGPWQENHDVYYGKIILEVSLRNILQHA